MACAEDLGKLAQPQGYLSKESETLLSKFQIPITHFEFDYIEKCNDDKEVEKILQVLRSGEEGHYPDLMKTAEERLKILKPKSKLLRTKCLVLNKGDLDKDEQEEISKDLQEWVADVSKNNKELQKRKTNIISSELEIRTPKEISSESEEKNKEKRISSTDYTAWDKYDPDTEILKMELAEEIEKKAVIEERQPAKVKLKKCVTFNQFATEAEADFVSNREREKGKEYFKAGDYEEALQCFTTSILSKPGINNLNNRAATNLKLNRYQLALDDCERVLSIDSSNLKAHLRMAESLAGLKRFEEALSAVEFVIQMDPNNTVAQGLAERVRSNCVNTLQNTRMKIVEIE